MTMTTVQRGKRAAMNYAQRKAIDEHLSTVCERVFVDGAHVGGRYLDGHSDETVAVAMAFPCTPNGVAYLRRSLFGNYYYPPKPAAAATRDEQIADLSARVEALEKLVADLTPPLPFKQD